jgi:hypothetical protein
MGSFNVSSFFNLGFLGSVLSIIITIILYRIGIKRMAPNYFIVSSSILAKTSGENSRMKILWGDKEVKNVYNKKLAFYNSGITPIRRSDISNDFPISVKCPSSIVLLDSYVSKTNRDIRIESRNNIENNIIELRIVNDEAFERTDGFIVDILYTTENYIDEKEWSMEGRIIGVPKGIRKINTKIIRNAERIFLPIWALIMSLFFIFVFNIPLNQGINAIIDNIVYILLLGLLGAILFVVWKLFLNNVPLWLKKQYWEIIN